MMTLPILPMIFTVFAGIAVGSATLMLLVRNPVHSALFLVLTFFASAGLWMLAEAEFLSLILILVYVGAVMTLFLFVVMMLNSETGRYNGKIGYYTIGGGLLFIGLLGLMGLALLALPHDPFVPLSYNLSKLTVTANNTVALGNVLYTDYVYPFEIAGVLLLVAIIAAITLSHHRVRHSKMQDPVSQLMVRREERIRLVKE